MSALNSTTLHSAAGKDYQIVAGTVGAVAILAITVLYYTFSSKAAEDEFPKLRGVQLYHAWSFFQRRFDFVQSNFRQNPGKSFSFNVLHHKVVTLAGEDSRRAFFSNRRLDLDEGYKLFMGSIPRVEDVNVAIGETQDGNVPLFLRKFNKVLNKDRIQDSLPALLQDAFDKAEKWGNDGKSGRIDPFIDVHDVIFSFVVRLTTCHDLTKNETDLKKIKEVFETLQTSATPTSLLLPWFPSPARKAGRQATTEMYTMLYNYVENRRDSEPTNDGIDILIADGETSQNIVGFIMGILFAGVVGTGIVSCWMLIDLAIHPEWREKCRKEAQDLLSRHFGNSPATLHEKLGAVPLSAWEEELPTLDACIRETQRVSLTGFLLRRNIREEIKVGGQIVRRGDFLVYSVDDVHLNPEYYPDPYKYDPSRWLRADPGVAYPFVGWGAGAHPCAGMKLAKLEMKLIMTLFLMRYEYDLVDKDGKFPDPLPSPDKNDIHKARPLNNVYFDFKRVAE